MTEPGVKEIRERTEELRAALEERRLTLASGLVPKEGLDTVLKTHSGVWTLEAVERVREALDSEELDASKAPLKLLLEAQMIGFMNRETVSLLTEVESRECAVVSCEGLEQRRPGGLLEAAACEADPEVRRRAEQVLFRHAAVLDPLLVERFALERGVARKLGYETPLDVRSDLGGIDPRPVVAAMWDFLGSTRDLYRELMGWSVKRCADVELVDATLGDVAYTLARRQADLAGSLEADDAPAVARAFLREMGLDMSVGGNLSLETARDSAGITTVVLAPVRVPGDVRLIYRIPEGRPAHAAFLGALGRGLALTYRAQNAGFEFRALGDPAIDRTFGRVFDGLMLSRVFLKRRLGATRTRDLLQVGILQRLTVARATAARCIYELELRKDDSVADRQEFFGESMRDALGFSYPPELYLYEVRESFDALLEARSLAAAGLLTKHLIHYFDEDWFRNPRSGQFLRDLWAVGSKLPLEAMTADLGYDDFSSRPLVELFERIL